MRKASQGSHVCMVGIRFVDPKNEESFSRKSCMYGWDLICNWIPKMRKAFQESLVCTVGIRFVDPKKMRKASQGSLVCTVGI